MSCPDVQETIVLPGNSSRIEIRFVQDGEDCKDAGPTSTMDCVEDDELRYAGSQDVERLIMTPPPYSDLGKDARGILSTGYHFGLIKLDCKTTTRSGVEISSGLASNRETGDGFGSVETKYGVKEYGLNFSEKWNTDKILGIEMSLQESNVKGLKLSLDSTFAAQTGENSCVVKSEFKNNVCTLNCDADLNFSGPRILASAVLCFNGCLAGYQIGFDTQKSEITQNNLALGYAAGDFILHSTVNNGTEFESSIFHRISSCLQTAIQIASSLDSSETTFGIGCKYDLDNDAAVRAKVNNASQIGIGYSQKLREGITVSLSALIDGMNFNEGGNKFGVALELEA